MKNYIQTINSYMGNSEDYILTDYDFKIGSIYKLLLLVEGEENKSNHIEAFLRNLNLDEVKALITLSNLYLWSLNKFNNPNYKITEVKKSFSEGVSFYVNEPHNDLTNPNYEWWYKFIHTFKNEILSRGQLVLRLKKIKKITKNYEYNAQKL